MRRNLAEALRATPDSLDICTKIVNACADAKAREMAVFNASKVSDLASYFVIASGHSDRQVQGIANKIIEQLAKYGIKPVSVEGLDNAHWVILDFNDILVHIFYEPDRLHYNLEGLWTRAGKVEIKKKPRGRSLMLKLV